MEITPEISKPYHTNTWDTLMNQIPYTYFILVANVFIFVKLN